MLQPIVTTLLYSFCHYP